MTTAYDGVDGMAMGFAEDYGYSVVATVERNGVRLFLAMGGLKTFPETATRRPGSTISGLPGKSPRWSR